MSNNQVSISLNFLPFNNSDFEITFYYQVVQEVISDELKHLYRTNFCFNHDEKYTKILLSFQPIEGFSKHETSCHTSYSITKQFILHCISSIAEKAKLTVSNNKKTKFSRVSFQINSHNEGQEIIWIEPYYLRNKKRFGLLLDYKFWVNEEYKKKINSPVDKRILQLSGTLDSKGYANKAYYQFKYEKIQSFIKNNIPTIKGLFETDYNFILNEELILIESSVLNPKVYQFKSDFENASPYYGLLKNKPFEIPESNLRFLFVFKEDDRDYAINLLNGLKGITSPSTFPGMETLFKIEFSNSNISGKRVKDFDTNTLNEILLEITNEKKINVLPIFITNSKGNLHDERIYYSIKHFFTKNNIGCQIVTKDLIANTKSLNWSLSNIGLQIFAKSGGKPWKVKPSTKQGLIIGIGSKHSERILVDPETGKTKYEIEKYLSYSVVTDSSGLFKEIEILSETNNESDYYDSLISKLCQLIKKATLENYKDIVIHTPFRISKEKVWDSVFGQIEENVNIIILIINSDHKYFGFDFSKNALVPYESTFIPLSENEYLVWFEGLQYNNAPFSKPIGAPIYINLWHSNNLDNFKNIQYKKGLLQDCINLSGANWRGFKAKQLPISIYYCQRISEFLKKFEEYNLEHIEFQNLKPWFL